MMNMQSIRCSTFSTLLLLLFTAASLCEVTCAAAGPSSPSSSSPYMRRNLPGQPYDDDGDDDDNFAEKKRNGFQGSGRDFSIFDSRERERTTPSARFSSASEARRRRQYQNDNHNLPPFVHDIHNWWTTTFPYFPKLQPRFKPSKSIKIRKTIRPLGTTLKIGADIPLESTTDYRLHGSWGVLGGQLSYQGGELRLTRSWALPVSMGSPISNNNMVTRLRLRCAVDTQSWKAYARLGFRTEQLTPLNFMDGFPICFQVPLINKESGLRLEFKSRVQLPEPEIEISTEIHNRRHALWAGMADLEVDVEETNLLWDF